MPQEIQLKRSAVPGKVPTIYDLDLGEIGINTYDGRLFFKQKDASGERIVELGVISGSVASNASASLGAALTFGVGLTSNRSSYNASLPTNLAVDISLFPTLEAFNAFSQSIHNWSGSIELFTASYYRDSASFDIRINSISGSGASGSFIQNQYVGPQTANFWISGPGRIDNELLIYITDQGDYKLQVSGGLFLSGGLVNPDLPNNQSLNQFVMIDTGSGKFYYRSGSIGGSSSSIDTSGFVTTSSFNNFSQSIHNWSSSINIFTASVTRDSASFNIKINNLNNSQSLFVTTSSFNNFSQSIHNFTSSLNNWSSSINQWSASLIIPNVSGFVTTSSFNNFTQSINTFTSSVTRDSSSFNTRINNLNTSQSYYTLTSSFQSYSQSLNVWSASINLFTASVLRDSASFDIRINNLNNSQSLFVTTSSFNNFSQSIHNWSSSINTWSSSLTFPSTSLQGGMDKYIALWTGSSNLTSSILYQTSSRIGILTTTPISTFHVSGTTTLQGQTTISGSSNISQLIVRGNITQSNSNPIFKIVSNSGEDLIWFHSDYYTNIFIGREAGTNNLFTLSTTGYDNIGIGYSALNKNTTGFLNTVVGKRAMAENTIGTYNTAFGAGALQNNVYGINNVSVGYHSLFSNIGNGNVAIGTEAMLSKISGSGNIAIGRGAHQSSTGYNGSIAIGEYSLIQSSGDYNIGIGSNTLYSNVSGLNNIGIGINSGYFNTGSYNTLIGGFSGYNSAGSSNVFIGFQAGYNEPNSNKLYIANSTTTNPLIGGDFSSMYVTIGGTILINSQTVNGSHKLQVNGTSLLSQSIYNPGILNNQSLNQFVMVDTASGQFYYRSGSFSGGSSPTDVSYLVTTSSFGNFTQSINTWSSSINTFTSSINTWSSSLENSFIKNQNSSTQNPGRFWISGSGRIDSGLTVYTGGTIFESSTGIGLGTGKLIIGNSNAVISIERENVLLTKDMLRIDGYNSKPSGYFLSILNTSGSITGQSSAVRIDINSLPNFQQFVKGIDLNLTVNNGISSNALRQYGLYFTINQVSGTIGDNIGAYFNITTSGSGVPYAIYAESGSSYFKDKIRININDIGNYKLLISGGLFLSGGLVNPDLPNNQSLNQFVMVDTASGQFYYRSGSFSGGSSIDTSGFVTTSSFNNFSQSIHNWSSSINTWSASINLFTSSVTRDSASFNIRINNLNTSQSYYTLTSSFQPFSQSLNTWSSSINIFTSSVIRDSASFDIRINALSGGGVSFGVFGPFTQSIHNWSSSINAFTSSINAWSSSLENNFIKNQFINTQTASLWISGSARIQTSEAMYILRPSTNTTTLQVRGGGGNGRVLTISNSTGTDSLGLGFTGAGAIVEGVSTALSLRSTNRDLSLTNIGTGNLIFSTNNTERGRFFNNGNLVINRPTDGGYKVDISGSTRIQGDSLITGSLTITGSIRITGSITITGSGAFSGRVIGADAVNNNEFITKGQLPSLIDVENGVYTPVSSSSTNVSSASYWQSHYMRIGSVVHVGGMIGITPIVDGVTTKLDFSIPVASAFNNHFLLTGTASPVSQSRPVACAIYANTGSNGATMEWYAMDATTQNYFYTFTYYYSPP